MTELDFDIIELGELIGSARKCTQGNAVMQKTANDPQTCATCCTSN
jgi:hypothetical protein